MRVKLGELTKIQTGKLDANASSPDGEYPFFTCSKETSRIATYSYDCECVLVAGNGDLNVKYYSGKFDAYQRTYIIENNSDGKLFIPYLYYFMCRYVEELRRQAVGGVIKYIKLGNLTEALIELPDIEMQKQIVTILEKVEKVINEFKELKNRLDDLVQYRFVEMFGDPETNLLNWGRVTVGELILKCESGWSGNGKQKTKMPGEIAVLKVSSVTKGYFIPEECKVLEDQENIKKLVYPQSGDLLFSRANTKEMVGASAVIKEDFPELILPDKLWKIRFKEMTNVFYMKQVLSSKAIRKKISAVSTGTSGSMYNVSMEKFRGIQIPVPPLKLQNQFATFVHQIDKSKVSIQKALDKTQTLLDSLMQQYFG